MAHSIRPSRTTDDGRTFNNKRDDDLRQASRTERLYARRRQNSTPRRRAEHGRKRHRRAPMAPRCAARPGSMMNIQ